MKICIVINSLNFGGAEKNALNYFNYFQKQNIPSILLILKKNNHNPQFFNLNKNYLFLDDIKSVNVLKFHSMKNFMRRNEITKILIFSFYSSYHFVSMLFSKKIELIVFQRNDPRFFNGKLGVKIISNLINQFVNKVVFQTETIMSLYPKKIQKKGFILKNPIINNVSQKKINETSKQIIAVGRLVPQKNYEFLLDCFEVLVKKHQDIKLIIYGNGPNKLKLTKIIKKYCLENNVIINNPVPEIQSEISKSLFLVLTSHYEGIPNVLLDGLSVGIPMISSNFPSKGYEGIVVNEYNGYIVDLENKLSWIEKMDLLLTDENKRNEFSFNSINLKNNFSADIIIKDLMKIIGNPQNDD